MKSLAICVLVLGIGLVGCRPTTGWHCPDCESPVANSAAKCPTCNGFGNWHPVDGVLPKGRWNKD